MKSTMLFVALACAIPPATVAQETSAPASAERVQTRFKPPLGAVQRFRVKVTKRGKTQSWVEELRFERNGAGYLAHWRMDPASFSAEMRHPLLAATFRPFTGAPITLELDEDGSPLRVRDWGPLKARLIKSAESLAPLMAAGAASRGKADSATVRKVMDGVTAMYAQLSAEAAPDEVAKYIVHILGWGGHDRAVGETVEGTEEAAIPMLGASVERRIKLTLTQANPVDARFVVTAEVDGAALKNAMTKFAAMFENPTPACPSAPHVR